MAKDRSGDAGAPLSGVSRRKFLAAVGVGAAAAVGGRVDAAPHRQGGTVASDEPVPVDLLVNGRRHRILVEPRWSLLFVLRERLAITGTKEGCARGECGACTVLLDDEPRYACMTLAVEAEGRAVTTVEGLLDGEALGPVQQAFVEHDAFQCGYCTSGQIMAAEGLLRAEADPPVQSVRRALSGNLCRCGSYPHIVKAVRRAAELRRDKGGAR